MAVGFVWDLIAFDAIVERGQKELILDEDIFPDLV